MRRSRHRPPEAADLARSKRPHLTATAAAARALHLVGQGDKVALAPTSATMVAITTDPTKVSASLKFTMMMILMTATRSSPASFLPEKGRP